MVVKSNHVRWVSEGTGEEERLEMKLYDAELFGHV
jgi:hypothetical protein